jgi:YVTN family beta-propeller protein
MVARNHLGFAGLLMFGWACGSGDDSTATVHDAGSDVTVEGGADGGAKGGIDAGIALQTGQRLPTGDFITPTAARGSTFQNLSPRGNFLADHATSTVTSPDGKTLLVLTSGFNQVVHTSGPNQGTPIPGESGEWIFVYDISGNTPVQKQILEIPNSFAGIAFNPNGTEFYVAGGKDDNVHVFDLAGGAWAESAGTIALGHKATSILSSGGLGLLTPPQSAGLAVDHAGQTLAIANYENDSISIVDLAKKTLKTELDLRPGKAMTPQPGVAGGEFPFWVVIKGDSTAYVSSQRDREVDVVDLTTPAVVKHIAVGGQPNKMILNKNQSLLFVANGNSDSVSVIDTSTNAVVETVSVAAPASVFANPAGWTGANPNGLVLSPDEKTLYVTNGATNSVAVVARDPAQKTASTLAGLIPTGWYPTSASTSGDGSYLYVVNGKSVPGPACLDAVQPGIDGGPAPYNASLGCGAGNQYVWQLESAGLLTLPAPSSADLASLTQQVAQNDHFASTAAPDASTTLDSTMAFLREHIRHVIYVIKENRTYDQVLGDLGRGNGDPTLTMFPLEVTPNFHKLASQYVTLDAFLDTGETSGVGWNWSTAARTTDAIERNQPINYGKGGLTYDWEGTNRNINVGLATASDRAAALAVTPADVDLLPGAVDVSAPDAPGPDAPGTHGTGYLWDAAQRKGLSFRNYGAFLDLARYQDATKALSLYIPMVRDPFTSNVPQAFPTKAALQTQSVTDLFYRGFDQAYPDYWRFQEWNREFQAYVTGNNLPAFELVRLAHDHFGSFSTAIAGLTTPLLQIADNDAAVGALVAAVAASPYAADTLVFVIEDDAQDGPDHVDAHRSTAFVVGPYVKQGSVVSTPYTTVSMVATIEQILGLDPLGMYDGLAAPMSDVFDTKLQPSAFTYAPLQSDVLSGTTLFAPPDGGAVGSLRSRPKNLQAYYAALQRGHGAAYWQRVMAGQNFAREDELDVESFNHALWLGLMGSQPYPALPAGLGVEAQPGGTPWCPLHT